MRYIINEQLFMRRPPEGPVAAHVRPFGKWAFEQGYSKYRVHRRVVLAAGFSQWLGRKRISAGEINGEHVAQYLRHRSGQKQIERGDNRSLKQFLECLRRAGIVGAEKADCGGITPAGQCVREFERYLLLDTGGPLTEKERAWADKVLSPGRRKRGSSRKKAA